MKYLSCLIALLMTSSLYAETAPNQLTDSEQRSGWQLLFDGKSTDGWRNYKRDGVTDGWKIIDGALVRAGSGAGDIITDKKYKAFELSLEYKISKGGNSGVMFHVLEGDGPPWHTGPEIQVQDNVDGHDPQKAGWLYQLFKPEAPNWAVDKSVVDTTRPAGDWNQLYIRISKNDSEVCMNGVRYYRFKIGDKKWNEQVAASKFAKLEGFGNAEEGYICLQDHGNEVAYRNIKVREIADDGSVPQPIDGTLKMKGTLAFPNLKWDGWEAVDDAGKARGLRLMELTYAKDGSNRLFAASQYRRDLDVRESIGRDGVASAAGLAWQGPRLEETWRERTRVARIGDASRLQVQRVLLRLLLASDRKQVGRFAVHDFKRRSQSVPIRIPNRS